MKRLSAKSFVVGVVALMVVLTIGVACVNSIIKGLVFSEVAVPGWVLKFAYPNDQIVADMANQLAAVKLERDGVAESLRASGEKLSAQITLNKSLEAELQAKNIALQEMREAQLDFNRLRASEEDAKLRLSAAIKEVDSLKLKYRAAHVFGAQCKKNQDEGWDRHAKCEGELASSRKMLNAIMQRRGTEDGAGKSALGQTPNERMCVRIDQPDRTARVDVFGKDLSGAPFRQELPGSGGALSCLDRVVLSSVRSLKFCRVNDQTKCSTVESRLLLNGSIKVISLM